MIALLVYAVVSAVTVRNVGLLPGRSFRFRLLAVALVLAVGFTAAFITSWGVHALLRSLPLPNGMIPGEWAMLHLYLAVGIELVMLMLMVVASFMVRRKLHRQRTDRMTRS